jgi:ABC-type multidrug transport system ATPase subunit/pSer/pThr/pTyr-binding forkhead associated (FHA) protein
VLIRYEHHVLTATPDEPFYVGRDMACHLRVLDPRISRRHFVIRHSDHWWIEDLGSVNGTYVDGLRLHGTQRLTGGEEIVLGDDPDSPVVRVELEGPTGSEGDVLVGAAAPAMRATSSTQDRVALNPEGSQAGPGRGGAPSKGASRPERGPLPTLTVGRDPANTIALDSLLISRFHARLDRRPDGFAVTDLGSFNGTFINGIQIHRGLLREGDVLGVGDIALMLRGGNLTILAPETDGDYIAAGVTFDLPGGKRLLDGIGFRLAPRSLTAVIGPSGAGKSTLFRILTGAQKPTMGQVQFEGFDLFTHYAQLRNRIGVVPQDDVIHRQLTVRKALSYAAELRFPPDVPAAVRERRVDETLAELQLVAHADTPVSRLSGGQRKRTSVAMELLTEPSLLFLDEPTSGLDPGLDKMVMSTLRTLADGGRTVMVITHSVANLSVCDNVLVLGPGGKVAYFGPPDKVLAWFGTSDYADVFQWITAEPDRYQKSFAAVHPELTGTSIPPSVAGSAPPPVQRSHSVGRQAWTLIRRQVRVMASDRSFAIFNLVLPLVLGILALAVPGSDGLAFPEKPSTEAMQVLVILVVGCTFMGMSSSVRDLVSERPIFVRERAVGLSPVAYLGSKLIVFGALTAVQTLALTLVVAIGKNLPDRHVVLPWGALELYVALVATAMVGAALGLLISAIVGTNEQVMPLLVVSVMTQLVLCAGLIPVAGRAPLEQLSLIAPARWGFAAAAAGTDVLAMLPLPRQDALWEHHADVWVFALLVLFVQALLLIGFTYRRLTRAT